VAAAEEPLPVRIDALMAERRFGEVRPLVEQWCEELARSPGGGSALAEARARHVLGSVQDRLGDSAAAVGTFERALELYARAGVGDDERGAVLDEAGRAAQGAGRFELAERWLREAVAARSGTRALAAGSRAQLADVLIKLGRFEEAEGELREAVGDAGDDASAQWQVAREQGVLAQTLGRLTEALGHYDRALEAAGRAGPESGGLQASWRGQRGQVLYRVGKAVEGAAAIEAAADYLARQPEASAEWLVQENNLAAVWLGSGQAVRARDRLRRLLSGPVVARLGDNPSLITPWLNAGAAEAATGGRSEASLAIDRAERLAEAVLPEGHPLRAQVAAARLEEAMARGDREAARHAARRASELARAWLGRLGPTADDAQWLEFRRSLDAVSPLAVVGAEEPEALADAVLATQGLGLERLLAGGHATGPAPVTWQEAAASIPPDSVLVNFLWWRPLLPGGGWSPHGHYGAIVLRPGKAPVWTDLGPAAEVEARVRRVIHAARDTVSANRAARSKASLEFQSVQLWELVWARLADQVDGARTVLLRPDGILHFVPWAILREPGVTPGASPGRFFCQRYSQVRVLARASMAAEERPENDGSWRLVAVSDAPGRGAPESPPFGASDLSPEVWREILAMPALPGAARELEAIRDAAPPGRRVVVAAPLEREFVPARPAPSPQVLHFSGHGFAFEQEDEWGVPRLEAALVFADAAAGLRARAEGRPLPPKHDGLLTPPEAAALNLGGTYLVVLSACQTALGQWQPGEHLAGLRHAFIVAGARHVAATLWDVNDETAPVFIREFYRRLATGLRPDTALWESQRAWLEEPGGDPAVRSALAGAWTLESSGW